MAANHEPDFLTGGGAMGAMMRRHDWSRTAVGSPAAWPQSLRSIVSVLLTSRFAMWMGWGDDLTFFYNDAYAPTLGIKHGWALGRSSREVWTEIWPDIGPRIERVLATGEATWDEGLLLFLQRSGFSEETYHTFSYSPLRDDAGLIAGHLCVVSEDTKRIIGERQVQTLRDLAAGLADAVSEEQTLAAAAAGLSGNDRDIPFSLIYLWGGAAGPPRLACSTGFVSLQETDGRLAGDAATLPWPVDALWAGANRVEVSGLDGLGLALPAGAWREAPGRALSVLIARQGQDHPAGFLVVGLNPHRALDDSYADFLSLVAGQIGSGLANARAYDEERRRAEALAALDRAKTAFFSNVSHEFRTPLTLLMGPLQDALARSDSVPIGEVRALLEVGSRNALRLLRQVNTLLDFSRLEAGQLRARYRPVDLARLTAECAAAFGSAMQRAGLRYTVDCQTLAAPAYVDADMWERIVLNLLSNAFKFTFTGEVAVTLCEQDGAAVLTVRDSGIGIAADHLPHLFERFHRIEGASGRSHEGSGIGLALVRDLTRLHGGEAFAASAPGQGSVFTVRIPLGRDHLPADRVSETSADARPGTLGPAFREEAASWLDGGETAMPDPGGHAPATADGVVGTTGSGAATILLADDNADMRNYVGRLLEAAGHRVVTAGDGEAALRMTRALRPDLVLSDVMMPRLDGLELVRAIRGEAPIRETPIILLSARAGEEARISGLETQADDYLVKPFAAPEMLARVRANLATARLRRQARDEAIQREHRLRLILDSARDYAIIALDAEGRVTDWNEGAQRVLGFAAAEIIGQSWEALFTPEDLQAAIPERELARVHRQGRAESARWQRRRDGSLFWAQGSLVPLAHGADQGFLAIFRDRTAERMAERALRDLNETLERQVAERTADRNRLWQLSTDLIVVARFDATITAVNPAWTTVLGWDERELVGANLLGLVHPDDLARSRDGVAALAAGTSLQRVNRLRHRDGSHRWISWTAVPGGGVINAVGRDCTAERDKTAARELSEARLRSIFETSYQFQALLSVDGTLLDANPTSLAAIKARSEEVIGRPFWRTAWFAGTAGLPEQVEAAIRQVAQGKSFRHEWVLDLPTGQRAFDFSLRPVLAATGEVIAIVPEAIELTERRAAEEQLRQAQKMEAVGQLTGGLAHDFNNLLAAMSGSLELLATRVAQGRIQDIDRYLAAAQSAAKRAAALTHRLLAFSRRQTLDPKPTDMNRVVSGMEELIRRTMGPHISVEVVAAGGLWRTQVDQNQLENALLNLCINGRDAMPDGGRLTIETANRWLDARAARERDVTPGQYVSLCVSDTGTGMTPAVIARAFDPFFTTKPIGEGTGLGLSMIYGFVRQSGGQARIYSEPHLGTMVCLYLPRDSAGEQTVAEVPEAAEPMHAERGERVLVVEDEPIVRMLITDVLQDLGYAAIEAPDGAAGLNVLQSDRDIDLLITDVGLPGGMNGRQLADAGVAIRPALKVLFITGYAENAVVGNGQLKPGMHVMTKPFEIEALARRIRHIVTRP